MTVVKERIPEYLAWPLTGLTVILASQAFQPFGAERQAEVTRASTVLSGDVGAQNYSTSPLAGLLYAALAGLIALSLSQQPRIRVSRVARLLWAFQLLLLISAIWSSVAMVSVSEGARALLILTSSILIFQAPDPKRRLLQIRRILGTLILLSVLGYVLQLPYMSVADLAGEQVARGVFPHRNLLAQASLAYIGLVACLPGRSSAGRIASLCMALTAIWMSGSDAAFVCIAAAVCVYFLARMVRNGRSHTRRTSTNVAIGAFVAAMLALVVAARSIQLDWQGRTELWSSVWPRILDRPFLGWGHRAFWTGDSGASGEVWRESGVTLYQAHNAFFELSLSVGLVASGIGLALVLAASLQAFTRATEDGGGLSQLPLLLFAALSTLSLVETPLYSSGSVLWALAVGLVAVRPSAEASLSMAPRSVPKMSAA